LAADDAELGESAADTCSCGHAAEPRTTRTSRVGSTSTMIESRQRPAVISVAQDWASLQKQTTSHRQNNVSSIPLTEKSWSSESVPWKMSPPICSAQTATST
jgi:hypothetical protein